MKQEEFNKAKEVDDNFRALEYTRLQIDGFVKKLPIENLPFGLGDHLRKASIRWLKDYEKHVTAEYNKTFNENEPE